jgi:hypothetical protein
MPEAKVVRIRPISWKVSVQGKEEAEYVRGVLSGARIDTSECEPARDLTEPRVFSFVASAQMESPLTSQELQAILENDRQIEVAFDAT